MPAAATTLVYFNTSDATLNTTHTIYFDRRDGVYVEDGGWPPSVAAYMVGVMGGSGPYDVVTDPFSVFIAKSGFTAADVSVRMQKLYKLRDLADAWSQGTSSIVVYLNVQIVGSALPVLTTAIDHLEIIPPANYLSYVASGAVRDIKMLVTHRAWVGATASATSTATAVPNLMTALFGTSIDTAAADVTLGGFTTDIPPGYLLLGPSDAHLPLLNAESVTSWTGFATGAPTVITESLAHGGQLLRIPQATGAGTPDPKTGQPASPLVEGVLNWSMSAALGGLSGPGRDDPMQAEIYVALRNNDQGERWQIRPFVADIGGRVYADQITWVGQGMISSDDTPYVLYLGSILASRSAFQVLRLEIKSLMGRSGSSLDLDWIGMLVLADGAQAIEIKQMVDLTGSTMSPWSIQILSNILTLPSPTVRARATSGSLVESTALSYGADAYVESAGDRLVARYLATWKTAWRYTGSNLTLSATRYPLYPSVY
jgi:hypothetical protein